ncbi:hypothetical protein Tco_1566168 [Tanacetum coccineum]
MFKDNSYKAHEVHENLFEALEKSLERDYSNQLLKDVDEARMKKRKRHTHQELLLAGVSAAQESYPTDSLMNDDSIPDEQWKPLPEEERPTTPELAWTIPPSNVSDVENNWATALVSTYVPPAKNSLLAKTRDMTSFMNCFLPKCHSTSVPDRGVSQDAYYQISWVNLKGDQVRIDVNRPLPLGGPPGHVTIQAHFFFNKDLKYLRYGNNGSKPTLSISKMKVAQYPDFGLELLMPEQIWIDEVCTYDISVAYALWYFTLVV